jgi:hypothetical protein
VESRSQGTLFGKIVDWWLLRQLVLDNMQLKSIRKHRS